MPTWNNIIPFLFSFCLNTNVLAQLKVTFPTSRAVYQRNNANQATLHVGGYFDSPLDIIEARVIPRVAGQGTATDWAVIQIGPTGGQFYGSLPVSGGWYRLEIRGIRKGVIQSTDLVDRVGIGEVFLVAGQSNATGGSFLPSGPAAADDRVSSVNFKNSNSSDGSVPSYANSQLPYPVFVHLDANTKTAPFGNNAWCWGKFGDLIASRLNVPVLIFNAGWAGTELANWQKSINPLGLSTSNDGYAFPAGLSNSSNGYAFPAGMPFGHLRLALNNYIAQQGYRAILWHQGESDNTIRTSRNDYRN
ncbi:sialate O-acetylesterase, partial [Persicitalea sp.]|uniref:sialate O-acetylesterase n=1 Tax=Persicitalea sp. TaxID=3100273 RepID=UPI0035936175